jgi:RES domain-containing protein
MAFRWTTYDVPFWARHNSRPGRWHRVGDSPTQYWSLTPEAAWAELIRHEGLYEEVELDLVRMPLWVCRLPKASIVDLHVPEHRERYGLELGDLVDDDWEPCQAARGSLEADARGVIAPSPALPEHANVTLFGARRTIDWTRQPVLASTIPAALSAIGRPPEGLLARVRRATTPAPQDSLF